MTDAGLLVALLLALGSPSALASATSAIAEQLGRLEGHRVQVAPDGASYRIEDIAGEGAPLVGVVQRRGRALYLATDGRLLRLAGPLARPRITGPGYTIWALGPIRADVLTPRRVGVLAPPGRARLLTPRRVGVLAPPGRARPASHPAESAPARSARRITSVISGGAPTRIGGPQ